MKVLSRFVVVSEADATIGLCHMTDIPFQPACTGKDSLWYGLCVGSVSGKGGLPCEAASGLHFNILRPSVVCGRRAPSPPCSDVAGPHPAGWLPQGGEEALHLALQKSVPSLGVLSGPLRVPQLDLQQPLFPPLQVHLPVQVLQLGAQRGAGLLQPAGGRPHKPKCSVPPASLLRNA